MLNVYLKKTEAIQYIQLRMGFGCTVSKIHAAGAQRAGRYVWGRERGPAAKTRLLWRARCGM